MFSVIIPVYNVERLLPRCIESVMAQDYEDWELVLVNDGSKDKSGEVCDAYAAQDGRIRVIHSANHGVSHARNMGIDAARGEMICFIDSDDWVEKNYLSSMARYSLDDDTLVIAGIVHDRGGQSKAEFRFEEGESYDISQPSDFIVRNRIPGHGYPVAKCFRKRIFTQHGLRFDERISFHEDHLLYWQYLMHTGKIALTSVAAYHYVHQEGGVSLSGRKHPAANMVMASESLVAAFAGLVERFRIHDTVYEKSLYTELGLRSLMQAVMTMTASDYPIVNAAFRKSRKTFKAYYAPAHAWAKVVPFLFWMRMGWIFIILNRIRK